jgi:transcriptional regulator with XRE-family HTH domain
MVQAQAPAFAVLLRRIRQAAALTQEELAERAGLSVRGIKALEGGERTRPHRDTVRLLADALQLTGEDRSAFETAARSTLPLDTPHATPLSEPVGDFLGARPTGPLVGREEEWGHLLLVLDAVGHGGGRMLLLPGEEGVGKTRLAQEVDLRARELGFLVAAARCYPSDGADPLAPFSEVLTTLSTGVSPSRWRDLLAQSPPVEQLVLNGRMPFPGVGDEERRMARAVADLLRAVAMDRPLVLLVEDLQWADEGSITFLQHLARSTRDQPVLLLTTYRETEVDAEDVLSRAVRDLMREGLVERIPVRRLTPEGTAALVEACIGKLDGAEEFVEFVHRRSKGIPFFIKRMVLALGGRYRLVRQIGVGGTGRVFEAIDTRSGQTVATKIMLARTESDVHARLRFEQEGAILATLEHPNIVQVFGTFLEEHASCIVMELLDGQSLGQIIGAQQQSDPAGRPEGTGATQMGTSPRRVQQLMLQVLAALGCAHEHGIVHRDIKPDNIMVLAGDQVKVTDFGIARLLRPIDTLSTMTSTGMTMGTPLYMAPEQIRGERVDGRADLYAVGAVLYELVTGRPPFQGHDPLTVAVNHLEQAPVPPSGVNPRVPKDWDGVILKALAKDPAQRFQSAAEMEEAVGALSTEVYPVKTRGGAGATAWRRLGTRSQLLVLATAVVVVLGLIAAADRLYIFSPVHAPSSARTVASLGPPRPWGWTPDTRGTLRPVHPENPQSAAVDRRGDVFVVTGSFSGHIEEFAPSGLLLSDWGPTISRPRGPKLRVNIGSIAVDGQGNVYVADRLRNHLLKLSSRGRLLGDWGFQIVAIAGVAVDQQGNVYVGDNGNERILKLSGSGKVLARWATGHFTNPHLALDGQGNMYVVYAGENLVQKYSPAGKLVFQWGGSGLGQLLDTADVAVDRLGNVYVVDDANDYVVEFSSGGVLRGVWGYGGSQPGQFSNPSGVAVDRQGTVYVADTGNSRIQELAPSSPG